MQVLWAGDFSTSQIDSRVELLTEIVEETRDGLGTVRGIAIAASEPSRAYVVGRVLASVQVVLVPRKLTTTTQTGSQKMGFVMTFVKWVLSLPFRRWGFVPLSFQRIHFGSMLHHLSRLALARARCSCAHGF